VSLIERGGVTFPPTHRVGVFEDESEGSMMREGGEEARGKPLWFESQS
jgi:hypothetical protein